MSYKNIYFLFVILIFTSCGVKQVSTDHLAPMSDPSELNGRYINNSGDKYLSNVLFEMYNSNRGKSIDLVDIYSPSKDSLVISYVDASGDYNEFKFKGKFKGSYFEYYLEKKRFYLPPIYTIHLIEQRRIGKNKQGNLEVHTYSNHFGQLICFIGGDGAYSHLYTFNPYGKSSDIKLFSVEFDGKWGYKNRTDSIVIVPQYDYAQAFKNGLAKVFLNEKWGYIDSTNQIVIPIVYDLIMPPENGLLRVEKDSKWGLIDFENKIIAPLEYDRIDAFGEKMYGDSLFLKLAKVYKINKVGFINTKGEEIIPVIYDEIGYSIFDANQGKSYRTKQGDKYGYVTGNGIFCDPIFDKAKGFLYGRKNISDKIGLYAKVKYQGKSYILDQNGMLYTYKHTLGEIRSADFDNGIKISK